MATRKKMKAKRTSLGGGIRKTIKKGKTGKKWINPLPDDFQFFEPKAKKTYQMDILPFVVSDVKNHPDASEIPEDIWFRMPYRLHRNIGPENEAVLCPACIGKKCPICDERKAIYDDEDGDDAVAAKLKASPRALYVVRLQSGPEKGEIKIFDMSDYCFWDVLGEEIEMGDPDYENFANLEGGYTLKVRFKEQKIGKDTTFPMADRIDFIEREDIDEEILDELPNLDKLITFPSTKEVQELFEGSLDEDDASDEDDDYNEDEQEESENKALSWDDLLEMDESELIELSEVEQLGYDDDSEEYDDEDDLRNKIAGDLDIEMPKRTRTTNTKNKAQNDTKKTRSTKRNRNTRSSNKSTKKAIKCPFAYQFGEDFEEYDECEDCEKYEECMEAYENAE